MTYPLTSIVIPNWNGKKHLEVCLSSLRNQTYPNYEIIIVDNGSNDGSVEFIYENYANIKIIKNEYNLGFAKATNQGIIEAFKDEKVKYIATLNNDTKVDYKWLSELVNVAESDIDIGSCQSKILNYYHPTRIDSAGIRIFNTFNVTDRGRGEIDSGQYDKVEEIFGACAGAALYRKEMLLEIGLFDEDFFAYLEDVDLAWRGQLMDWKCMYVPTAIVYHVHSATTGHKSSFSRYMVSRNRIWCVIKNASSEDLLYNVPLMLVWEFVDNLHGIVKYRDFAQIRGKIDSIHDMIKFFDKRKNIHTAHRKIKNESRIFFEPFGHFVSFELNKLFSRQ